MKSYLKFIILITTTSFISCHTAKNIIFNDTKDIIFNDTFDDNRNNWDLKEDYADFSVEISEGNLKIEKRSKNRIKNGCLWLNKPIANFSTAKDFSIIFSAKILSYDDVFNGIDFQWGAINNPNQKTKLYQINLGVCGEIYLDYFENGWTYLSRKNLISEIKSNKRINGVEYTNQPYPAKINEYNKYEIAQVGSSGIVYINNIKVYSEKIDVVEGNYIGIQQCLKSSWKIDYLIIKQKK
ncbi:MAG: hypothetical protein PHT07_14680 [Paludibacter sp.]|nr:hypothetical protein [Paludibacter sp.]